MPAKPRKSAPPATTGVRMELVPLEKLAPLRRNVRKGHRIHALAASIQQHGFGQAITVNETTGVTIAGNGRVKALAHLRRSSQPPPAGITVSPQNQWLVPTYFGRWTLEQETAVALALNGGLNHSLEGEWDTATIADLMAMAKPQDLEALNIHSQQAEQFSLDFAAPIEDPVINLDGLDRVASEDGLTTVRLKVPEQLAARARKVAARGVTANEILTYGLEKLDPEEEQQARPAQRRPGRAATAQVEQPPARAEAGTRPRNRPAKSRGRQR